MSSSKHL